ncbi:26804_t:CDS:10 [Dentiscutata erythropus]|uniref:26804_t:CDS:1 n=1 Tax=Dentiscutata erythropus TaxID=1348616 RepID=A0A9N9EWU3_9GLOM|nr:26804_t:CDS:10 [Dentiscutata erythropus]
MPISTLMDFYRYTTFIDWTCANIVEHYRDKLERKDWEYVLDKIKKDLRDITASESGFSVMHKKKAQEILDCWKRKLGLLVASDELLVRRFLFECKLGLLVASDELLSWTASNRAKPNDIGPKFEFHQIGQQVLATGNNVSIDNIDNRRFTEKHRRDHEEEETIAQKKKKRQFTELVADAENNPFFDRRGQSDTLSDTEIVPSCPAIINDVIELELGPLPRKESRWFINDTDVSERWHLFKEKSLELANREGLFVESHTQQILSLSHILLLKPKQHCPLIVEVFGDELLVTMYEDIIQRLTKQETEFDSELLMKLIRIVKRLQRKEITRDDAVSELQILTVGRSCGERAILRAIRNIIERVPRLTLKGPVGEVELCITYIDTILSPLFTDPDRGIFLRWSNKEVVESKARKPVGRAKQPDAIIKEIDQLSWSLSKGHGEAKVQEEMNNLYLLCTDLIRIAVFNKDAIDFYNMNCMLGFQVVGHHITFYLTTLLCDALYVMIEVGHIDVPMSLEQVPTFLTSLDTLLIIFNAYWSNCTMSTEKKEPSKRSTLATPSFKEMVSKSRDRHRPCQLRF